MKRILVVLMAVVMLAVCVNAAFEKVNTYNGNFTDVAESAWYAENVKMAYELGFMNGKSEGMFDPNGNVTVVEGITMAARLHAIYNGNEIKKVEKVVPEVRFDFDDDSKFVDLSERASRNNDGISFNRAKGVFEDGLMIVTADGTNASGAYDPQITINGLDLPSADYNTVTFRMKRDALPNTNNAPRNENVQIYFKTSSGPSITDKQRLIVNIAKDNDPTQWFEKSVSAEGNAAWKDIITGIRFDPTDNNGVYYFDYIVFSRNEEAVVEKWYDMYVDYALANGVIQKNQFFTEEYTRNITRAEMCDLLIAALPEEYFNPINDINGIPDVPRDMKNADVYLMLYKAGIVLGDTAGNFNAFSDIKRSEVAAIINRVALPENRVKGTVNADWASFGNEYDVEFNDEASLEKVNVRDVDSAVIENGALVMQAKFRGADKRPPYDPKVGVENISINADDYTKLRVRIKADYIGEVDTSKCDFYFLVEGDSELTEKKSLHPDLNTAAYLDPAGWYILEVDFATHKEWKGTITGFRFDPPGTNGVYTIDYIRLTPAHPFQNASHDALINAGYTAQTLFADPDYERGFYVTHYQQNEKTDYTNRKFVDYCETDEEPLWWITPIWNTYDLWEHRDTTTDKYTIKDDKGISTVIYNPESKSVTMRLDATKIYNGEPHVDKVSCDGWWPHLLLNQQFTDPKDYDREKNAANADRVFVDLDVRLLDFKDTLNKEGSNGCSYYIYFYLYNDKAPGQKVWFGMTVFGGTRGNPTVTPNWVPDSAAHQYLYNIREAVLYHGMENSFNPSEGVVVTGEEWKHIRLDLTPHIDRVVEWANRDNIFGIEVTKDDMFFTGANIGYEVKGNYDCTIEIKNFDMTFYNKD